MRRVEKGASFDAKLLVIDTRRWSMVEGKNEENGRTNRWIIKGGSLLQMYGGGRGGEKNK